MVRLTYMHGHLFWFLFLRTPVQHMLANCFTHFCYLDSWPCEYAASSVVKVHTLNVLPLSEHWCGFFFPALKINFFQLNAANFLNFTMIWLKPCKNHTAKGLHIVKCRQGCFFVAPQNDILNYILRVWFPKDWIQAILGFQSPLYLATIWGWMGSQSWQMFLLHWPLSLLKCSIKGQCLLFIQFSFFV